MQREIINLKDEMKTLKNEEEALFICIATKFKLR